MCIQVGEGGLSLAAGGMKRRDVGQNVSEDGYQALEVGWIPGNNSHVSGLSGKVGTALMWSIL